MADKPTYNRTHNQNGTENQYQWMQGQIIEADLLNNMQSQIASNTQGFSKLIEYNTNQPESPYNQIWLKPTNRQEDTIRLAEVNDLDKVVIISQNQPNDSINKLWIKDDETSSQVITQVPSYSEFTQSINNIENSIASEYSETPYNIGDYCMYDGKLYKCKSAIINGEEWNNAHWTQVTTENEIGVLKSTVNVIDRNLYTVEEILLDEVPVSIGTPTRGVFEANGPASLTSDKFVYFPKLGNGTFTVTPATGWSFEFYKYEPATGSETRDRIYSFSSKQRTINATDFEFVITARLQTAEVYTQEQLSNCVHNTTIIKANSDSIVGDIDDLNTRVSNLEGGTTGVEDRLDTLEEAVSGFEITIGQMTEDIETLNTTIFGHSTTLTWNSGAYEASGITSTTTKNFKYSNRLPAGQYTITPPEGLRWEAYLYVSDSAGTLLMAFSSKAKTITATEEFIITIGKTGGGSLNGMDDVIAEFSAERPDSNSIIGRIERLENGGGSSGNFISHMSNDIQDDRYENIEYVNLLANLTTIDTANATFDNDVRFQGMPHSIKITTSTASSYTEAQFTVSTAVPLIGTQEFDVYLYVADASSITRIRFLGVTTGFNKAVESGFTNGWNKLRFLSEGQPGDFTKSDTQYQIRIYTDTVMDVWVGGAIAVKPDKANIIMIADGPYKTYYDSAYPAFENLGVPITWALDPAMLGDNTDANRRIISQEEVDTLAYDGMSEFSFHCYDGTIMSSATAEVALADTLKCIRYLREHGLEPNRIFRAAWLQNNCPNHQLADLEVDASATYNPSATGVTAYPFPDRYNIPRYSMQGRAESAIDTIFEKLRTQHSTILMYTHGVSNGDATKELSPTLLQYYLTKISTGINAGWLRATTYNRLVSHYRKIR